MSEQTSNSCKNCGTRSKLHYCPACGQRISVYKVTFKETFEDLADALFTVNAPLIITLKLLIINPGKLFTSYLEGQRRKYYKPVAFFLLTTLVYLLIRSLIGINVFENSSIVVQDSAETGGMLTKGREFMLLNINNLLFFFVFTLAIVTKLFFYSKQSLAEYLAVSFYLVGMYTIIVTLNLFLVKYIDPQFQPLAIPLMGIYFLYAILSFFKKPVFIIIFKGIVLYFLALMSYAMLAFGLSVLIVYLNLV
ncbi:DUF3667 domain-containing protein [uncultured Muriicola sp.]|uniref:DUF3667 domain-containing protein n=1 Tax=uncultured Muriicola sp. TaxID=1583102 RepID=UPI00260ECDCD|nr:DUF3667 domain-containing protein [uncultured Muriicola sp.]